jgi:hypothetical protein
MNYFPQETMVTDNHLIGVQAIPHEQPPSPPLLKLMKLNRLSHKFRVSLEILGTCKTLKKREASQANSQFATNFHRKHPNTDCPANTARPQDKFCFQPRSLSRKISYLSKPVACISIAAARIMQEPTKHKQHYMAIPYKSIHYVGSYFFPRKKIFACPPKDKGPE